MDHFSNLLLIHCLFGTFQSIKFLVCWEQKLLDIDRLIRKEVGSTHKRTWQLAKMLSWANFTLLRKTLHGVQSGGCLLTQQVTFTCWQSFHPYHFASTIYLQNNVGGCWEPVMPSADCYSNSDQDCGSVVKYTLQCEYPERVDFGPDKFGAFFGDVELGRIVQVSGDYIMLLPNKWNQTEVSHWHLF